MTGGRSKTTILNVAAHAHIMRIYLVAVYAASGNGLIATTPDYVARVFRIDTYVSTLASHTIDNPFALKAIKHIRLA